LSSAKARTHSQRDEAAWAFLTQGSWSIETNTFSLLYLKTLVEFELRALLLLGKYYNLSHSSDHFCFSYFFGKARLYSNPFTDTFWVARTTGTCQELWPGLLVEMGPHELFAWAIHEKQSF
jgi:hypothetical protein